MKFKFGKKQEKNTSFESQTMEAATNRKNKIKELFGKKSVRIISILLLVCIIAGIVIIQRTLSSKAASSSQIQRTTVVRNGNISSTITGSGPLSFSNRVAVTSKVASTITAIHVKEGDRVKAGDVLAELDDTDVRRNYEQVEDSVIQNQLSLQSNLDTYNDLTVIAPFSGQVKNLSAEVGSTKGKTDSLMTLVDISRLKATLTFSGSVIKNITVGKTVTVYIQDFMESIQGKVIYVGNKPYSTSNGGELYNVDIEIVNPGSIQEGMKISVDIDTPSGTISSMDSGTLSCYNKTVIKSSAGGTVKSVNVRENQFVNKGDVLVTFENKDVVRSKENAELSAKAAQAKLDSAKDQLNNCKIVAPIDGIVSKLDLKAGDTVKVGDTVVVVSDDTSYEFKISVDELDIDKVKEGQKVNVTFDALADTAMRPLTGKVSKVAVEGTSSNGVTTYAVTIKMDKADRLKSGMNANAEVIINSKSDVLTVPLQAVQRIGGKNYVMVKADQNTIEKMKKEGTYIDVFNMSGRTNGNTAGSGQNNRTQGGAANQAQRTQSNPLAQYKDYYSNAVPTPVEVGINNELYIEITSGLKEGDEVILPPTTLGTTQNRTQGGGAMPFGGGPVIRRN